MDPKPDYRDIHRMAEIFHQLKRTGNPEELSREAERILGATEPENEFMAIAIWSGRCSLAHKLAPDKYPLDADAKFKVPDLFMVFEHRGKTIPALVEVKSDFTLPEPGRINWHEFSPSYREKLKNYGKLLGFPVLVAQQIKPVGLWFLVDLDTIGLDSKQVINTSYDLTGELLGFFHLEFREGIKFRLVVEKTNIQSETEFDGVIREACWETSSGRQIDSTKSPMMILFGLGDPIEKEINEAKRLTLIYEIPHPVAFVNYQALSASMILESRLNDARYPWSEMLKLGTFPISSRDVELAQEDCDFFDRKITTKPKEMPDFLKC